VQRRLLRSCLPAGRIGIAAMNHAMGTALTSVRIWRCAEIQWVGSGDHSWMSLPASSRWRTNSTCRPIHEGGQFRVRRGRSTTGSGSIRPASGKTDGMKPNLWKKKYRGKLMLLPSPMSCEIEGQLPLMPDSQQVDRCANERVEHQVVLEHVLPNRIGFRRQRGQLLA